MEPFLYIKNGCVVLDQTATMSGTFVSNDSDNEEKCVSNESDDDDVSPQEHYQHEFLRHQEFGYGRPITNHMQVFEANYNACEIKDCTITEKVNGYLIRWVLIEDLWPTYALVSKRGHNLETSSCKTLRAIYKYMDSMGLIEKLHASHCLCEDPRSLARKVALAMNMEFIAEKRVSEQYANALGDLLQAKCVLPTGDLNTADYRYRIVITDVIFSASRKSLVRLDASERLDRAAAVFGEEYVVKRIRNEAELKHTLLHEEGVVIHHSMLWCHSLSFPKIIKVKLPKWPIAAEIVAVANTLAPLKDYKYFCGWDIIYYALKESDGTMRVVHTSNFYDIFTDYKRREKGYCYVNPHSVRRDLKSGTIYCDTSSVLQPMLDALYKEISKVPLIKAKSLSKLAAVLPDRSRIVCGSNRTFEFDVHNTLFLKPPIFATLAANQCWKIANDEVHLQAAGLAAMKGYGKERMHYIPRLRMDTLRRWTDEQPTVEKMYTEAGIVGGPLDELGRQDSKKRLRDF